MCQSCDAGMHAWFGAAVDDRYAVVAPIIGVQVCKLKCIVISICIVKRLLKLCYQRVRDLDGQ